MRWFGPASPRDTQVDGFALALAVVAVVAWIVGGVLIGDPGIPTEPTLDAPAYVVEPVARISVPNP